MLSFPQGAILPHRRHPQFKLVYSWVLMICWGLQGTVKCDGGLQTEHAQCLMTHLWPVSQPGARILTSRSSTNTNSMFSFSNPVSHCSLSPSCQQARGASFCRSTLASHPTTGFRVSCLHDCDAAHHSPFGISDVRRPTPRNVEEPSESCGWRHNRIRCHPGTRCRLPSLHCVVASCLIEKPYLHILLQ